MDNVIKKWELILEQDSNKDIVYDRKVLEEMLTDFKHQLKEKSYYTFKCDNCGSVRSKEGCIICGAE